MSKIIQSSFIQYLIKQCKHPTGFIGRTMIHIWNKTFLQMALWGLSHVAIKETDQILEIGFGGGRIIERLSQNNCCKVIYGVDVSQIAVEKAGKLNHKHIEKGTVKLFQGSAENLSFLDTKFDKIFAIQTHIYWDKFEYSIKEVFEALNIGGEFNIICEKDKILYHLPTYIKQKDMLMLLKQHGFNQTQVYETKHWIQYQSMKGQHSHEV